MEFSNLTAGTVTLDNKKRAVAFFDVKEDIKETTVDCMHHIHILDRSGSMTPYIDDLIEDVKKTIDIIDDNDLVTVLWFSGPGQYRTILKGARAKDRTAIKKLLDSLKSTVGLTCFSEPLQELKNIIEETLPMCEAYNIILFTDGEPVTPWPESEEIKRIFEAIEDIKNKVIAFNTIGYGNYYNRKLLIDLARSTEYGVFFHASQIDEYHSIFEHTRSVVQSVVGKQLKLNLPLFTDIIGITSKTVKSWTGPGKTRLAKNNSYMLVFEDGTLPNSILINDEPVSLQEKDFSIWDDETKIKLMYAYAYKLFELGKREESTQVLNLLGDEHMLQDQINCFTNTEVGEFLKIMFSAIFCLTSYSKEKSGKCFAKTDAYCVLDLLQELVKAGAMYHPVENYKRVTRKRVDQFNLFTPDPDCSLAELNGLIVGQDRLNLSIRFAIPGKVKLNPIRAKAVGLPNTVPANIFRTHCIVQDGQLHIDRIEVQMKTEEFKKLNPQCEEAVVSTSTSFDGEITHVIFDLSNLPVINASYAQDATADNFFELENRMLEIEAQNKYINTQIPSEGKRSYSGQTDYTPEQIAVLAEHGMRQPGVYSAVSTEQAEIEDKIIIRQMKTMMKGFSSLPSFDKVTKKLETNKKMTDGESLLYKYMTSLEGSDLKSLSNLKEANNQTLKDIRFKLAGMKIATVLTGKEIKGLQAQEDGSFTYTKGDRTLVVKRERFELAV